MFTSKSNWLLSGLLFGLLALCASCKGKKPDLTVQLINTASIQVTCPGGPGTCVTTVSFTIANTGNAKADAFNVKVTFDPGVTINQPVPAMPAGATQMFTLSSPPGGNCFNPDCTICVEVDDANVIQESNEGNNKKCQTKPG
ncbi:MAG: hypothetical protein H6565_15320 [Lewinellaceae bacterium]|nr:hypothetical protein [Lewinellaceae bacterium]